MDVCHFEAYTEEMIAFMFGRLTEDETLARAMRHHRLWRMAVNVGPVRRNIAEYRDAAHRVMP